MKESKFYQEILEEGRLEGRVETLRQNIRETLEVRFGAPAGEEFWENLEDAEELSRLHRLATGCRRLAEFRRGFSP